MKIPILSTMPRVLRMALFVFLTAGLILFTVSLFVPEKGREGYWTAFLLHGVAECWGFALGIFVTFVISLKLCEEKVRPILNFIAHLRKSKVIEKRTARGIVMCAAKIFSEEKLTKDMTTSIKPLTDECGICALSIETRKDFRCRYCGLLDHYWKEVEGLPDA